MTRAKHNLFSAIPANLPEELCEDLLVGDKVRIERIVSRGQATPIGKWYDQEWDEWVLLIQGEATVAFTNGESVNSQPGDYLHIAAHNRHRVEWTSPDVDTIWLAIHF